MAEDKDKDRDKWNNRYSSTSVTPGADSSSLVLSADSHLLPTTGIALDLACGPGSNAILLAKHGLETHAWDISDIAISKLIHEAESSALEIQTEVRDVVAAPPSENSFDVIVVSRFLERSIIAALVKALKPNGLIFYQTFITDKNSGIGPSNPDYLLKTNELLKLFQSLTVRVYREEGLVGDTAKGFRSEAMLVAQKVG
jgi:2-polyprenyl-3-methyl-5-hydroxy-6-metoxy-1,4-benzoquinol methylase